MYDESLFTQGDQASEDPESTAQENAIEDGNADATENDTTGTADITGSTEDVVDDTDDVMDAIDDVIDGNSRLNNAKRSFPKTLISTLNRF